MSNFAFRWPKLLSSTRQPSQFGSLCPPGATNRALMNGSKSGPTRGTPGKEIRGSSSHLEIVHTKLPLPELGFIRIVAVACRSNFKASEPVKFAFSRQVSFGLVCNTSFVNRKILYVSWFWVSHEHTGFPVDTARNVR